MQRVRDINLDDVQDSIKWYYDACTLTNQEELKEVINSYKKRKVIPIISHLCVGEAFSSSHLKSQEKLEAFIGLISGLGDHIKIVENDGIETQLEYVNELFSNMGFCDKIHLATALRWKCCLLKSRDGDFTGITKEKLDEVARKCGYECIRVRKP